MKWHYQLSAQHDSTLCGKSISAALQIRLTRQEPLVNCWTCRATLDNPKKRIKAGIYNRPDASRFPLLCAWCTLRREEHGEGEKWIGHVFQDAPS